MPERDISELTRVNEELEREISGRRAVESENARLYRETLKRTDELQAMLAVQRAITSRLELDTVLNMIAVEACRLTHSQSTSVLLVDGGDLVFSVYSGPDQSDLIGYRTPIESTLMGRNLLLGKSFILQSPLQHPNAHQELLKRGSVKSLLSVPLIAGTKPVGVIASINKLEGEFDEEDERVLNMFAASAVIGIENARMYQEERRRHQEDEQHRRVAEGLRDILAKLNSNRPFAEILEHITREAARLMGTDTGALLRLRDGGKRLSVKAHCGLPREFVSDTGIPAGLVALEHAVMHRKPVVLSDMQELAANPAVDLPELQRQKLWLITFCHRLVTVPLLVKDEMYGCILLYIKEPRTFKRDEMELIATFADQAALAVENTRLREKAEVSAVSAERNRLARDLHDAVTQTLFSTSLIAEVLPKIWDRNREEGMKRLEEIRQLTRGALAEMRTLLLELRPATLMDAKLTDLLRQLSDATFARARIPVTLKLEGSVEMPTEVKIGFYRITQEALNNIAKHSGASQACVSVTGTLCDKPGKNSLELRIADNGRGFDPGGVGGNHLGLGIMKERAEAIGARFSISSHIGQGTELTVLWEEQQI